MASLIHEPHRPRKPWRADWLDRGRHRTKRFLEDCSAASADRRQAHPGGDVGLVVAGGWDNWTGRAWRPAVKAAGVPSFRPYDCRHLCASLLIAEGRLSLPEIAAQMGHSLQVLLRTYAHVIEGHRGAVGRPLDDVVLEARHRISRPPG